MYISWKLVRDGSHLKATIVHQMVKSLTTSIKMMRKLIAFIPLFSSFPILLFITIPLLQLCPTTSSAAAATAISGGKSNETDHQTLLQFKSKISSDPFSVLTNWNTSIHFCQWYGVSCGRRHQRVTRLDLKSLKLAGTISPHVGNLSFLRVLDLRNNSFSNEIPQEIGHLHRLERLFLGNNTISGQIPSNISNLVALDLSGNQLVGHIPPTLGFLSKLQYVNLRNNNLTETIPHSLGNLSHLVAVNLCENLLVGSIPDSLGLLASLNYLNLASNRLSGTIPASIFNLSSITKLDLGLNDLSGNLSPDLFISLPNITYFSIFSNRISGPIPTSLCNSSNMAVLQLQSNQLTGRVPFLHKVQDLRYFTIASNYLGSGEANDLSFLASFLNATILEELNIGNNSFGGVLPPQIGNFSKKIKGFELWDNQIQGSFPFEIGNLINLEVIDAKNNQLSGIIPYTIGKLQNLKILYLYDNMFSESIPSSLGNISQLIDFRININDLSGSIPSSLGKCQNLLVLDLSQNNLTGPIPPQVIGLPSLVGVDLSANRLSGVIPLKIGNMKQLGYLNLSSNMLSGVIPSTLSSCTSLEYLYLDNNLFEGSIPSSLSSLRALEYLDLSRNRFSGEIPEFLPHLNVLQYLNLSFNNLEGSLPTGGIFQNASATFVVGNSKLCGGIPEFQLMICSSNRPNKKGLGTRIKLIISIVAGILGLISVMFSLWLLKRRKIPVLNNQANTIMQLSYHNLYEATEGFSSANLIGEGSFGSVYKGAIEAGRTLVAVKVLNLIRFGAFKSFKAECEALKNIRHRNLVRLLTVCSSIDSQGNDFKALVYEFMVNGSLEEWLHHHHVRANLLQRLHIAIDVACALDYLHHQNETPIVHCDLKPSNILLDDEMIAHVGDFGLARFLLGETNKSNDNQSSSMGVRGTIGYAPPEYGMGNKVAICGDVYSYGILLLEMFTGKRPMDDMFTKGLNLHNFVQSFLPEQVKRILDPVLHQEIEETNINMVLNQRIEELLVLIFKIGVACSVETPKERMRMDEVAAQLISIRAKLLGTRRRGDRRT